MSSAGTSLTSIAYPLLTLAVTHSAAKTGVVIFVRLVPFGLFSLVAGLAADRWSRRGLMIAADAVRVVAIGILAGLVLTDDVGFWAILSVAFVEGVGATFFVGAEPGALRAVVPRTQLAAAAGAREARRSVVRLAVVIGFQLAVTPDRLVGRVESVRTTISLLVGPVGPLLAGLLLEATSARTTVAVFAAVGLALALWGTLSPSLRAAPSLSDLGTR